MIRAKTASLLGALISTAVVLVAGRAMALDDPAGYWATEKHESQIKITHCGAEAICGSIFWMKEPNDAKGNPKLDRENEEAAKRKRTILGLQLINMKLDDDQWKGTVYNPQNGKTYSATLKVISRNEVELKGCVAYVLCGGQNWTREEPRQTATAASVPVTGHTPVRATGSGNNPTPAQ